MTLYQKSLDIQERLVRDHPTVTGYRTDLANGHRNVGLVDANAGRWDERCGGSDSAG